MPEKIATPKGSSLPFIPRKLIRDNQRHPVAELNSKLEAQLTLQANAPVQKYIFVIVGGRPGENEAEVWVVPGHAYYRQEFHDEIEALLRLEEMTFR